MSTLVKILKLKFRRDFEAEVCSVFCCWCLVEVTKLNLGKYSFTFTCSCMVASAVHPTEAISESENQLLRFDFMMFLTFSISAIMILFCSKMDQLQLHLRLFKVLSSLSVTPNTWLRLTAELCDPIVHVEYYHFVSFITYNLAQPLHMMWSHCISWIWFYKKNIYLNNN